MPISSNDKIDSALVHTLSETNGLSLMDTINLMAWSLNPDIKKEVLDFKQKLHLYGTGQMSIQNLFDHSIGKSLFRFFKKFPIRFREEHIHLTGSLTADFIYPRLKKLLEGPNHLIYEKKIKAIYGDHSLPIKSAEDIDRFIRLPDGQSFDRYLLILYFAKIILIDRQTHQEAAYHLAEKLWNHYNIGAVRLKFSLSRATTMDSEQIPDIESLHPRDVILGLYQGFKDFQREHPEFCFILSPCFRKEQSFYDSNRFKNKKEDFDYQISELIKILKQNQHLREHVLEVDTVGSEKQLYRKSHFQEMKPGLQKLQSMGIKIRSHHGETWNTLLNGIQSVDNAMNIWHIDAVEHGLSLGINPNYYFHRIFQKMITSNSRSEAFNSESMEAREMNSMDWSANPGVPEKILQGEKLDKKEFISFVKTKFHMAREVEHYQHDVLNRMIDKQLSMIALPSSNKKLTGQFMDYKDHPFSWWEKKGLKLGVGTDNYITLNTNYIKEMLILLFTDPVNLKITKLLLVCTGETRRPYISQKLWEMRKQTPIEKRF